MWLGHHSPAFTLATYVHLLPDDLPVAGFLDGITATPQNRGDNGRFLPGNNANPGASRALCSGQVRILPEVRPARVRRATGVGESAAQPSATA
jgi:hypothetical protein